MSKKKMGVFFVGVVFMFIVIIGMIQTTNTFTYKKLTKSSQIPAVVKQELDKVNLQRGIYFFSNQFTGSDSYLVICGGNEFRAGYDVDVKSVKYVSIVSNSSEPVRQDGSHSSLYGFYEFNLDEKQSKIAYNYSEKRNYPIIVYRIKSDINYYWLKINCEKAININHWSSAGQTSIQSKDWVCKVIRSEHEMPKYINLLNSLESGVTKELTNSEYSDTTSILITGKQGEPPFRAVIEAVHWQDISTYHKPKSPNTGHFEIVIRKKYSTEDTMEHNSIPYSIVTMKTLENYDFIRANDIVIIDDKLNWTQIH
ncbi:hypothetical protein IMX26_13440 [Clostridium sp. 'deep sea']|uniref:hypothetical protein n=1 Tax=Clostridium sp. 'deep sea' TaxID=2779445 RepID=UPI001896836E|nr:hypothetical protein [Clostridium sp. 'deep sea']QOR34482.1 hypothetical protein IMX26_13440 [Clostridium sp. 'deep sea']